MRVARVMWCACVRSLCRRERCTLPAPEAAAFARPPHRHIFRLSPPPESAAECASVARVTGARVPRGALALHTARFTRVRYGTRVGLRAALLWPKPPREQRAAVSGLEAVHLAAAFQRVRSSVDLHSSSYARVRRECRERLRSRVH